MGKQATAQQVEEQEGGAELEQGNALAALEAFGQEEQGAEQNDQDLADKVSSEADRKAQKEQERKDQQQAAQMGAAMAVGFAENMLKMRLPFVVIEQQAREGLVDSLAPVMEKHGGGMPAWLQPYAEELRFGMTLAGVGFGVWMQVQDHKAANDDSEQEPEKRESKPREPEVQEPEEPAPGDDLPDYLKAAQAVEAG